MNPMTPDELEKFIHRNLRSLPARRAPGTLESRVHAAIGQRAPIPWYHRSWSHWPGAVQAVFLGLALSTGGAAVAAFHLLAQGAEASALAASFGDSLSEMAAAFQVAAWLVDLASRMLAGIPPYWLYSSLAFIAVMYAAFFGLGVAAYRALYRSN